MLGWALPSLPAKQLLEGAKPAPRQVPFVGLLVAHSPPAAHQLRIEGLLVWVAPGLAPACGSTGDAHPAPSSASCWEEGKQAFCLCHWLLAVTLSQLLLLVPLRAFNWSLFLTEGRSLGENWKFSSGSF